MSLSKDKEIVSHFYKTPCLSTPEGTARLTGNMSATPRSKFSTREAREPIGDDAKI